MLLCDRSDESPCTFPNETLPIPDVAVTRQDPTTLTCSYPTDQDIASVWDSFPEVAPASDQLRADANEEKFRSTRINHNCTWNGCSGRVVTCVVEEVGKSLIKAQGLKVPGEIRPLGYTYWVHSHQTGGKIEDMTLETLTYLNLHLVNLGTKEIWHHQSLDNHPEWLNNIWTCQSVSTGTAYKYPNISCLH